MDKRQLTHDVANLIERLRIMHDLAKTQNFESISKTEVKNDLEETLTELREKLLKLIDVD